MSLWVSFAIAGYFLLAVNGVIDKFLLTKAVKHPVAYAFYVGIGAPLTLLLIPIGYLGAAFNLDFFKTNLVFQFLTPMHTFVAIIGGACFPLALYFSYKAIQQTSISRILPVQGGLVPCFTLVMAYAILGERLSLNQTVAFGFLVLGAILISLKKKGGHWHAIAFGNAMVSSFLFALSFTLEKFIFDQSNFGSGLVWTRIGFFLVSASFLIVPKSRKYIFNAPKEASTGNKFLFLGARVTGSMAGLFQNYAIAIGSVTMVNALQGTQYAFLLILTILLSVRFPKILKEDVSESKIVLKIASLILISIGLFFLVK